MAKRKATTLEAFEAELLERPEIRKEYEALKPKYDMIRCLIERRNEMRISQTELAEMTGTPQSAISRLERGDHNATISTLLNIAGALDLDVCLKVRTRTKETCAKADG